jgi:hypothetical protein
LQLALLGCLLAWVARWQFAPSGPLAAVGNVNTDVSSFFSLNADGNAFGANGIIPFAKGGIVNSPTYSHLQRALVSWAKLALRRSCRLSVALMAA